MLYKILTSIYCAVLQGLGGGELVEGFTINQVYSEHAAALTWV